MILDCVASIVVYKNNPELVINAANTFLASKVTSKLYIVDNSPDQSIKPALSQLDICYHYTNSNLGYGRGHNWAIENAASSKYHLILNPDVIIHERTIEKLVHFMDSNSDIGLVCPKVLNPDGSLQYLNKRYPTVFDLFIRRFLPKSLLPLFKSRFDRFEMRDVGYDSVCDVEFTTGCFMFCRTAILRQLGGFDPRYFLHLEDCDLGRMVQTAGYRTVFFPGATVTHEWGREPHKNYRMLFVMIVSMFRYFNKWGWKLY